MEAIILAGGKAERLGDAAGGRPKALVEVAGRPLAAYQVARLAQAGVTRVIFACAAGQGSALRVGSSPGSAPEIVAAEEPERLGRGGGIKFAARAAPGERRRLRAERRRARRRRLRRAARRAPCRRSARDDHRRAAEVAVRPRRRRRRRRRPRLPRGRPRPVLGQLRQLRARRPRRSSASPTAATTSRRRSRSSRPKGALHAYRHEGLWLTVNTPKELRVAAEHVAAHPEWLA